MAIQAVLSVRYFSQIKQSQLVSSRKKSQCTYIDIKKSYWIQKLFLIAFSEINDLPYKAPEEFAELSSKLRTRFSKKSS